MPILNEWDKNKPSSLPTYPAGTPIEEVAKIMVNESNHELNEMVALEIAEE